MIVLGEEDKAVYEEFLRHLPSGWRIENRESDPWGGHVYGFSRELYLANFHVGVANYSSCELRIHIYDLGYIYDLGAGVDKKNFVFNVRDPNCFHGFTKTLERLANGLE